MLESAEIPQHIKYVSFRHPIEIGTLIISNSFTLQP
jgi:hypothetical protein